MRRHVRDSDVTHAERLVVRERGVLLVDAPPDPAFRQPARWEAMYFLAHSAKLIVPAFWSFS